MIRLPPVARVPQAPKGLLGLANLRGTVLPVASLRGLLGVSEAAEAESGAASRAIVLDGAAPVALVVDAIERAGERRARPDRDRARPSSPPSRASG